MIIFLRSSSSFVYILLGGDPCPKNCAQRERISFVAITGEAHGRLCVSSTFLRQFQREVITVIADLALPLALNPSYTAIPPDALSFPTDRRTIRKVPERREKISFHVPPLSMRTSGTRGDKLLRPLRIDSTVGLSNARAPVYLLSGYRGHCRSTIYSYPPPAGELYVCTAALNSAVP